MNKVHKHVFSLAVALVLLAVGTGFFLSRRNSTSFVFAQGIDDVVVDFESAPLFDQDNMLPGDELIGRWFKVTNNSTDTDYPLYFVAQKDSDDFDFASVLNIEIEKEGERVVLNKTLRELFDQVNDSDGISEDDGFPLGTTDLEYGTSQKFFISVEFAEFAGNEFKNKEVVWDALLGFFGTVVAPDVLAAETGGSVLGIATGANLIYSVLGSLAALGGGLYLRRRSSSVNQPHVS